MTTMRPIRTLATTLLIASLAAAGCGRGQPDQPTTQPSQPAVVTTAPTPKAPNPTPPTPVPTSRPRVLSITTIPDLPGEGGFRQLPPGAGTIVFRVRAVNAQRVRFYLTPTGTAMFNENQLIGEDTNGRDGWTLAWRYPNQPLAAHVTVRAIGPGGTSPDSVLGLYHPGPNSRPTTAGARANDRHDRLVVDRPRRVPGPAAIWRLPPPDRLQDSPRRIHARMLRP
jgi:hypothetical protein